VARKIPGRSELPRLTTELPQAGLIKTSVRYFRGYLGFMNFYTSLGRKELRFEEGVSGEYASGATLYVLQYPSEESLRRSFPAIAEALRKNPKAKEFSAPDPLAFHLIDDRGKLLSVQAARNLLLICLTDPGSAAKARELFDAIRSRR
jgi:hypothetical protein